MILEKLANKKVVTTTEGATLQEVARIMRDEHVGSVVVVEERAGRRLPKGILTDRDIVVSTCAFGIPLDKVCVRDVMSPALATAKKTDSLSRLLNLMKEQGVKRVPITDAEGDLEGLITSHELLQMLSEELSALSRVTERQHRVEADRRPRMG